MRNKRATLSLAVLLALLLPALPGCRREVINATMRRDSFTLYDVAAVDGGHAWAVGSRGKVLFFDGNDWSEQDSGTKKTLFGVSAVDENRVWAVGEDGTVLRYDGSKWAGREVPTTETLYDCAATDGGGFWAVGRGVILSAEGSAWNVTAAEHVLRGVTATSDGRAWAAGDGVVLYFDGSWKEQFSCSESLKGITAVDGTHVWAVGCREWATPAQVSTVFFYDGEWERRMQFPDCQLLGISASGPDCVWAVGMGANVFFDGSTWRRQYLTNFEGYYGTCVLTSGDGWIVGYELGGKLVAVPSILTRSKSVWTRYNPPW